VIPGSTKRGDFYNVDVKVEVLPPTDNFWASTSVRMGCGRLFVASSATIFQNCIFYQGSDLEMYPGKSVTINGDIISNGSIYMGASGGTLTLTGNVSYLNGYGFNKNWGADEIFGTNPTTDPLSPYYGIDDDYTALRKPGTQDPGGPTLTPPVFSSSQATQLKTLPTPENLLGGADVTEIQYDNPALFPTVNDVYRSVLLAPPEAGNTNEYTLTGLTKTDDPTISAERIYNQASLKKGLIITINADGTATITAPGITGSVPNSFWNILTTVSGSGAGKIVTKSVHDLREGLDVRVVEIDVGALTGLTGHGANNATITTYPTFNGILYVNQMVGDSSAPAAVRLINATAVPRIGPDGQNGFSVATNGGIYVKGSYNTDTTGLALGTPPPAMLAGDALTVLSNKWDDANAVNTAVSSRVADSSTRDALGNIITASTTTTINAGLLTGNTQATSTTVSGGVQNLVRYLEDWSTGHQTVQYTGALGRLFDAKMFTRPFQQPGSVYMVPDNRNFNFNTTFLTRAPPGSLKTTSFNRGRFYYW